MESPAPVARPAPAGLDPHRWWALALLCGAFFMVLLDGTITIVALPSIGADLGFARQDLPWVLSAYALTFGGLLLLGGRAADLLGRRRVFMAGVLFFTAASLMCGLTWSPAALLAARVVQGAGAAIMTPTALSMISTTFPEGSERNKALGIWGGLGGIGATTAWLIGGPLVDGPGWQWIFFINIPARGRRRARVRARLGPVQHRLADRHSARRRHRLDRCRLPLCGLPDREQGRGPARRADRGLPVRVRGLRRAGRDRPRAGPPAPRPAAQSSARAAGAGPGDQPRD